MSYVCEFAAVHDLASTMLVVFFLFQKSAVKRCGSDSPFKCFIICMGSFGSRRIGSSDQQQVITALRPAVGHSSRYALSQSHRCKWWNTWSVNLKRHKGCTNNVATQLGVFEFDPRRWWTYGSPRKAPCSWYPGVRSSFVVSWGFWGGRKTHRTIL